MLDGALASTLQPIPLGNKMSLPAKAQSKDSTPGVMRLLPRLLPLRRLLLHLLFLPPPRTSSPNSWRCSWRRRRLRHKQSLENDHLRLDPRRPIQGNLTWIAITFVSNVRIISKLQAPLGWIIPHLQPHLFMAPSTSDRLSTSAATRAPLQSHGQNSKPSSKKTSEILRPSLTTSGVSSERTPSTSWKRPETGHHTFSTSNPSWQSLTRRGPQRVNYDSLLSERPQTFHQGRNGVAGPGID